MEQNSCHKASFVISLVLNSYNIWIEVSDAGDVVVSDKARFHACEAVWVISSISSGSLWCFHAFWGRWVSDYLCWCQKLVSTTVQVHVIIKCVFGWHSNFFLLFLFLFHSFPLSFPLIFFFVYFSFSDNVTNVVQVDKDTKFITDARILLSMLAPGLGQIHWVFVFSRI